MATQYRFKLDVPATHAYLIPLVFHESIITLAQWQALVLQHLYALQNVEHKNTDKLCIPNIQELIIEVKDMEGVAHTFGSATHKTIALSSKYLDRVFRDSGRGRLQQEIAGVMVHEMVHVWQYNGIGTADGGLIEGIADFVRLRAGLEPPHWRKTRGKQWNQGYETTGYFLDWIDKSVCKDFVIKLNQTLVDKVWCEQLFEDLTGKGLQELWKMYQDTLSVN